MCVGVSVSRLLPHWLGSSRVVVVGAEWGSRGPWLHTWGWFLRRVSVTSVSYSFCG